jgi:diketogulonate reductase-like aldo/keto reductase
MHLNQSWQRNEQLEYSAGARDRATPLLCQSACDRSGKSSSQEDGPSERLWRGPEEVILPLCQELEIGFVPWSPLGVQFLTGWIDENTRFAPGDSRGMEPRFSPENLKHNIQLVKLVKQWAERKHAAPGQIALAWLMAQKPWIVPIPGTTQMAHMVENAGANSVAFTSEELKELDASVSNIQTQGERLPAAYWRCRASKRRRRDRR